MFRSLKAFTFLGMFFVLSACAGTGEIESADCPKVAFVGDTAQVTQFSGNATGEQHVISRAQFTGFEGGCKIDQGMATIDLKVKIGAEKGLALKGDQVHYAYFVAITDPKMRILEKEKFETTVKFPKDNTKSGTQEDLTQAIPLLSGTKASDYHILIGFQLTPEQLAYNRNRKMAFTSPVSAQPQ